MKVKAKVSRLEAIQVNQRKENKVEKVDATVVTLESEALLRPLSLVIANDTESFKINGDVDITITPSK